MLFKKKTKPKPPSFYAVIDFSDEAKKLCVGGDHNLRIKYYQNGMFVDEEMYSEGRVKQLIEQQVPVVWKARWEVPIECINEPKEFVMWGRIKLGERWL